MTTIYVIVYDYLREVSSHYTRTWTPSVRATGCSRACENVDHMRREVGENSQGIPARTEAALRRASCAGELVEWISYSRRIEHATDEGDDLWEGGDERGESKGEPDRSICRYHTTSEQSGMLKRLFVSHARTFICTLRLPGGQESLYSMGEMPQFVSLLHPLIRHHRSHACSF